MILLAVLVCLYVRSLYRRVEQMISGEVGCSLAVFSSSFGGAVEVHGHLNLPTKQKREIAASVGLFIIFLSPYALLANELLL